VVFHLSTKITQSLNFNRVYRLLCQKLSISECERLEQERKLKDRLLILESGLLQKTEKKQKRKTRNKLFASHGSN
jgi:hypothetical protein